MKNNRVTNRHDIKQFLSVVDEGGTNLIGNILDISESGMRVLSELNRYPIGTEKNIGIELLLDGGETENYSISAQAIWIKLDEDPAYCQIGFRFLDAADDAPDFLRTIINNDDA